MPVSRSIVAVVILIVLVPLPGCAPSGTSDRTLAYVTVAEADTMMGGRRGLLGLGGRARAVWVDARGDAAFRAGHLPGAVHLPLARVSRDHEVLGAYDTVVVYGDGYRDPVAEALSKRLVALGYGDVRTLRGGVQAWTDAGRSLENGP